MDLTEAQAEQFAALALGCIHREYPNKISHVLNSLEDVRSPRELTPAFFGCYDWHSAVHNHWVLVRLVRLFPEAPFSADCKRALDISLTPAHIAQEVRYVTREGRESFERPYGLAWLLQLAAELKEWSGPEARAWSDVLAPLEVAVTKRLMLWLAKLARPVRTGEHSNTAFAMGLMLDYARSTGHSEFERLLLERAEVFYRCDQNCPLMYEPSGEDFFSACLAEADLMRRILSAADFAIWLMHFLPDVPLEPVAVVDQLDGKSGHLIGLDLSRAWMLNGIVSQLTPDDVLRPPLLESARKAKESGLSRINAKQYHGVHWLGTFAVYLLSGRSLVDVSELSAT